MPGAGGTRRTSTIITALLLCTVWTGRSGAGVGVGVAGGIARYGFSGDSPDKSKYRSLTRGTFGGVVDVDLGENFRLSLQPSWMRKGTEIAYEVRGQKERVDSVEVETAYLSLPIMLKVFTKGGKWFVSSGVELGWLVSARWITSTRDDDIEGELEDLDVAIHFGVGRIIPLGRNEFFIEGRYTQSVLNVIPAGDPDSRLYGRRVKNSGMLLLAGFLIRL